MVSAARLEGLRLLSRSRGNWKERAAVAEVEKEDVQAQSCPSTSSQALTPSGVPGKGSLPCVRVSVCPAPLPACVAGRLQAACVPGPGGNSLSPVLCRLMYRCRHWYRHLKYN